VFLSDVLCDPLWFNELYFTTKEPERKVIAQWAIIANGPDCRERGYHKVALRTFSTASDSFEVFFGFSKISLSLSPQIKYSFL
jgi:hypothetical protein